jgi:hypothetical protein
LLVRPKELVCKSMLKSMMCTCKCNSVVVVIQ